MWVRSEYAGELAVLSAWLCALLPWSVSYASDGGVRLVRIHFLYLYFQFAPGSGLAQLLDTTVLATDAARVAGNRSATFGYRLWVLGAVAFTVALAGSLAYYRLDARLEERSPVDPVRAMGGLLGASGLLLAAATYFVHVGTRGFTVPVGVLFMVVLGGSLLVVERTEATMGVDASGTDATGEAVGDTAGESGEASADPADPAEVADRPDDVTE